MYRLAFLLGVLLVPGLAHASDYACGDVNGLRTYLTNTDPSQVLTQPDCNQIPEEATEDRRDFLKNDPSIQTNNKPDIRKVRVVGGLPVAKTQADRDAIDAADAQKAAEQQALNDEKANNPVCTVQNLQDADNKLAAIKASVQTTINAATNISTAQTAMTKINDEYNKIAGHIVKCLFAIVKGSG